MLYNNHQLLNSVQKKKKIKRQVLFCYVNYVCMALHTHTHTHTQNKIKRERRKKKIKLKQDQPARPLRNCKHQPGSK